MTLPSAHDLKAIFAAAREYGVTHLRVGPLDVRFAAPEPAAPAVALPSDAEALLAGINAAAPLPPDEDPLRTVQREAQSAGQRRVDPLEVLSTGGRLLVESGIGA